MDHLDQLAFSIDEFFQDERSKALIAHRFARDGYLRISEAIPDDLKNALAVEARQLLDNYAVRRDVIIPETGNTPRRLSTVSQPQIQKSATIIPQLYRSEKLMTFLGGIAGATLHPCPWPEERFLILKHHAKGDTHGWHWGDYSFTLIWVLVAPPAEGGGLLQCVPHTVWNKEAPAVNEYILENKISTYHHRSGDVYFLKSNTTLHRTTELTSDVERIILNLCWASEAELTGSQSHETMHSMFA